VSPGVAASIVNGIAIAAGGTLASVFKTPSIISRVTELLQLEV
jgi:hypothetical protein